MIVALFCLLHLSSFAQKDYNIDYEVEAIVAVSLRFGEGIKSAVDSMVQIAGKTGNGRLMAYGDFLDKAWHLAFDQQKPAIKQQQQQEVDKIAESSQYIDLRGHAFVWKAGGPLWEKSDNDKGLYMALKGKKLLEEVNYEAFPYAFPYHIFFMEAYNRFEDYQSALYHCKQTLKHPAKPYYGTYSAYNDLGTLYLKLGFLDSAKNAFEQSVIESKKKKLTHYEGMALGNIGNILRKKKQYHQALPYLYESIYKTHERIPEVAELNKLFLADCLLSIDSVQRAAIFLQPSGIMIPDWSQPNYDFTKFEIMAKYNMAKGNFKSAIGYKDSLIALEDSIKIVRGSKKVIELESILEAEKFANERTRLLQMASVEKMKRNFIIAGLAVLLLGLLYWFNQRRKRAAELLERANQQLGQYLNNIKEKNTLIDNISKQLEENNAIVAAEEKQAYLDTLQKSVLLTEENWSEFKKIFEQVFPRFFQKIGQKYPDLTAAETRLLALEKLELPDKDMGNMLGISADSIRKTRYRLVKKHPEIRGENNPE